MDAKDGLVMGATISQLAERFPEKTFTHRVIHATTGEKIVAEVPLYLFRGESGNWPETTSSMQRIRTHQHRAFETLPTKLYGAFAASIEAITLRASAELESFLGMSQMQAAGFTQHYGLPTEFIDVTSSLRVATGFAVGNPKTWSDRRRVHIAVIDMRKAINSCIVADLSSMIDFARRPRVQHAYGFFHRKHINLKSPDCIADIGLCWHDILIEPVEAESYVLLPDLLDAHRDRAAGVLQLILDDLAKSDGKWPDEVAMFLADNVTAAPFITRVIRMEGTRPAEVELVPAEDVGLRYDEAEERAANRRLWSRKFPDTQRKR